MADLPRGARRVLLRVKPIAAAVRAGWPITLKGMLLGGGAAFALVSFGLRKIDLLLLVVGGVGLALTGLAVLVVVPTAIAIRLARRRDPEGAALTMTTGIPAASGFSLPSLWYAPLARITWRWQSPDVDVVTETSAAMERKVGVVLPGGRSWEVATPKRRGLTHEVVRHVEVRDAFGLAAISFRLREPRPVRISPSAGSLRGVPIVRALSGGDDFYDPLGAPQGDAVDMRAYAAGDPVRLVLWKVYARSRELVVRTPEKARSPTKKTVAYVVAGPGDEAAAGAARAAMQAGAFGAVFWLGADGCDKDATDRDAAEEVLARSGNTPPEDGGTGLAAFLARVAKALEGGNAGAVRVVLFVPARRGPWIERVIGALKKHNPATGGQGTSVLVCTDGIADEKGQRWWERWIYAPVKVDAPAAAAQRELAVVAKALSALRAPMSLVDRAAGRVFHDVFRRMGSADARTGGGSGALDAPDPKRTTPPRAERAEGSPGEAA